MIKLFASVWAIYFDCVLRDNDNSPYIRFVKLSGYYIYVSNILKLRLLFVFKIGTYDKDNWEITVERQEVNQVLSEQLSVVKLPTDLLDIDLIRGKCGRMKSFFIGGIFLPILG